MNAQLHKIALCTSLAFIAGAKNMRTTYGIVGQSNVSVTMIDTHVEDERMSVNDHGEALPLEAVTKRRLTFARHRLINHITGGADESAELPAIFPIN